MLRYLTVEAVAALRLGKQYSQEKAWSMETMAEIN